MHKHILHVAKVGLPVGLSAQSRQSLISQVGLHGIESLDEHVQPQIEFLVFQKQRRLDVALHEKLFLLVGKHVLWNVLEARYEHDTLATSPSGRLCNEVEARVLLHVCL